MENPIKVHVFESVPVVGFEMQPMRVVLNIDVPSAEFAIGGQFCTLHGEDLGKFLAWMQYEGYKLPR
jgi:hypothetical protein